MNYDNFFIVKDNIMSSALFLVLCLTRYNKIIVNNFELYLTNGKIKIKRKISLTRT